jgi:hypothetical protein
MVLRESYCAGHPDSRLAKEIKNADLSLHFLFGAQEDFFRRLISQSGKHNALETRRE